MATQHALLSKDPKNVILFILRLLCMLGARLHRVSDRRNPIRSECARPWGRKRRLTHEKKTRARLAHAAKTSTLGTVC